MKDEEVQILELAARVSDGREIDWESQDFDDPADPNQELLEELKTLESLAGFHRQSPDGAKKTSVTWAQLEIIDRLGSGSFGDVYRAWDPRLRRDVALKLLQANPGSVSGRSDSILREGRILARLKHPNVATVHGAAEEDGRVGVWMELIRGQTLGEIIEDQGPMGAREAAGIGIDVCRAVAALHREGLVHRDIKAQNVMRERGGRIVLMDFGLGARLPDPNLDRPVATLSGTPLYMAPELLQGEAASVQSDIYAIGVLLFYLVTGTYPVEGKDLNDLSRRHQKKQHQLLRDVRSDLPSAFDQVVERALAPERGARFHTVGELEQALDRALLTVTGSQELALPRADGATWLNWRRPFVFAALMALVAVAAAVGFFGADSGVKPGKIPIAVVYFDNYTGNSELDWLQQGIPDQLIYSLSQSNYLQVRSMDRMLAMLSDTAGAGPADEAGLRALGDRARVEYVVGGSVFLDDGHLTIISKINDLESGAVLPAQKVSGKHPDDLFEIVNQLSRGIRRALEIEGEDSPEVKAGVARLKTDSKDAYKAYVQCRQILQGRRYQEALPYCRNAVETDPDFLHAWDLLANLYDNLGERQLALDALDNAVRLLDRVPRPDQLTVLLRQAQIQEQWQDYEQYLKELQLLQPDDPTWPFRLGWHYATHRRDYDLAIREYRQALSKGAEPRVLGYACFALLSAGRLGEAREACRRFVAESPGDASAHDSLGFLLTVLGDYTEAQMAFQRALALEPEFSHSLRNLGELELVLGRTQSARHYFARYLDQASGEKQENEGRWSLGWFHWSVGQLEAAQTAADAALRQDPTMIKAHWLKGLVQVDAGDLSGARETLQQLDAQLRDSTSLHHVEFRHHLAGYLEMAQGDYQQAVNNFAEALRLGPSERPFFLVSLAEAQRAAGDPVAAEQAYQEALRINPRFPPALTGYGLFLEQRGEPEHAASQLRQALTVLNESGATFPGRITVEEALIRLGASPAAN